RQEILMKRTTTLGAAAFAALVTIAAIAPAAPIAPIQPIPSAQSGHSSGHHDRGHPIPRPPDITIPGFEFTGGQPVGSYDAYATLSSGNRVDFDGLAVNLVADDGTVLLPLGSVPQYVFPSFVRVDAAETFALVGESSNGDIFKVNLAGAGLTTL